MIMDIFKGRKGSSIRPFKKSAVVIPIIEKEDGLHIIFEMRALNLKSQPGDICLPGGKLDEGEDYKRAAEREFKEELYCTDEDFQIIGEMDYFVSPYGSLIYPFVAEVYKMPDRFNIKEVDHVFTVPIEYFLKNEPICYPMKIGPQLDESFPFDLIRGGSGYKFTTTLLNQYFYKFDAYVIWGFTALIVKSFIDILKHEASMDK